MLCNSEASESEPVLMTKNGEILECSSGLLLSLHECMIVFKRELNMEMNRLYS